MNSPDILVNAAKRFPDRDCVIEGDRSITFAEAHHRADRLAASLIALGLRPGDRVALLAANELEYLEIQVAAMRARLILVPLNFRLAVPELAYIVSDSAPRVLIHGTGYAEQAAALDVADTFHLGPGGTGRPYTELLAADHQAPDPRPALDDAAACTILYTSGTTDRPKGAIISNRALLARLNMFAIEMGLRPGDVFVQPLPMFHIAAHVSYSFAYIGATNVMVAGFDPPAVLALLERHHATHVLLVPTMIRLLVEHPAMTDAELSSLRLVLYGASPIQPDLLRRALPAFDCDFVQFYGMTETAGGSLLRPADHDPEGAPELLTAAGTDSLSAETRVVDDQDRSVPAGVTGEIVVRGPIVMDGYWNAPEATAEALRNGWMHTGDMGHVGENGYLYVSDRLKDMIVSGGENVYPREVEDVLLQHPGIAEATVIGLPDEQWGERVHALVVPRPDVTVDPAEVIAHCRSQLAGFKAPKTVELTTELPRNATGKVMKRELRERYWGGHDRRVS